MSCTGTATSNTITLPSYAPVNTVAPVISGTAVVGQTLTTTNGTWTNSPSSYSYQWKRGGVNISLATSSTYVLVAADAGTNITCEVTATNSAGSATATSNTLSVYASILDQYPSAAAAYSVRLLRGAQYNNALLRVRRSSDNAEVDVFVDSNYQLSLNSNITSRTSGTTLSSWVSTNNAFVVTWYDQSGSANNATQSTPANQPQIITSGSLGILNTKAAFTFNGTSHQFGLTNTITPASGIFTAVGVGKRTANSTNMTFIGDSTATVATILLSQLASNNRYYVQRLGGYLESAVDNTANQLILSGVAGSSTNSLRRNGVVLSTSLTTFTIANNIRSIGVYSQGSPFRFTGQMQEVLIWSADQSSNISGIETNINSFYGIY